MQNNIKNNLKSEKTEDLIKELARRNNVSLPAKTLTKKDSIESKIPSLKSAGVFESLDAQYQKLVDEIGAAKLVINYLNILTYNIDFYVEDVEIYIDDCKSIYHDKVIGKLLENQEEYYSLTEFFNDNNMPSIIQKQFDKFKKSLDVKLENFSKKVEKIAADNGLESYIIWNEIS